MREQLPPTEKYEDRIVAFVDILSFANIIKSTTTADKKNPKAIEQAEKNLGAIVTALDCVHNHFNELKSKHPDSSLQLSQFSDSIVISVLTNSEEIVYMLKSIKLIQVKLLCDFQIMMRGGIVRGELKHTDDLLLGPAMVTAYNLESKCALSPRIVMDPKVKTVYNNLYKTSTGKIIIKDKVTEKDYDGTHYIDYFNRLDSCKIDECEYFKCLCLLIKSHINSADISLRMKYLWLREKLKSSQFFEKYESVYQEIVLNKKISKVKKIDLKKDGQHKT